MNIVKGNYLQLAPRIDLLTDVVVLAQAWKKCHTAIRRINWYADVLELDCSTINLQQQLEEWADSIKNQDFKPEPMKLVLAPKNARWDFPDSQKPPEPFNIDDLLDSTFSTNGDEPFESWGVAKDSKGVRKQRLRPLAHISIRDQTLSAAVMLCLADAVESAQGDTSETDIHLAQKLGVFSYGNRLHCRWDTINQPRSRAYFSWGNSRTYRQYFQDYRTFLSRPRNVCADLYSRINSGRELFVVSLDIKSFYDDIDRSALIGQLKTIYQKFYDDFGLPDQLRADDDFWDTTERILNWTWRDEDQQLAKVVNNDGDLPTGLPQGLIASGFFANAYMINFDQLMGSILGTKENEIIIHDYCRYVDDIRLVIEAKAGEDSNRLAKFIQDYVSQLFDSHSTNIRANKPLKINTEKTAVTPYRSISSQNNLSALMSLLQETISGTFDLDSLKQAVGGLDGILWMSEQLEDAQGRNKSLLKLANIAVPNADVRDDTVKRFVAPRLASALRMRLAMTDTSGKSESDEAFNCAALNHEFETTARKLIKSWAENPALVLLLRVGLDIFPHPKLLGPVLDALQSKLYSTAKKDNETARQELHVAQFVSADLLRAGATETGYREDSQYPDSIDILKYRQDLALFARRILIEGDCPFYLRQQAMLFLASVGDHSCVTVTNVELCNYLTLHKTLIYAPFKEKELEIALALALVGQQLAPAPDRFAAWLTECLQSTNDGEIIERCVRIVSVNRPDLMLLMLKIRHSRVSTWRKYVPTTLKDARPTVSIRSYKLSNGKLLPLLGVVSGAYNPFSKENALLQLASSLLNQSEVEIEKELANGLNIGEIEVCCSDWSSIQRLPTNSDFLKVQFNRQDHIDPLYEKPPWVNDDFAWLYGLGRILRSCITGEFDFTTGRFLITEDIPRYSGWRSTWVKRRFGLINTGSSLLDEPAPISPWLSGLLSTLLQWPGTSVGSVNMERFSKVKTRSDILDLIRKRVDVQRALYGTQSDTPMYVIPTQENRAPIPRPMRIAVVQPMLPRLDQFNDKEPCRWSKKLMAEHRRHLAEVCRLTYQKLRTWSSAQGVYGGRFDNDEPLVDLILFPELSVHPEHIFHLRALSDKVGATIFAGLTFIDSAKHSGPINQGLWLIRTETPERGRTFQYVWQGKKHLTTEEHKMGVKEYRPHQVLIEFPVGSGSPTRVSAAICYDATDLALVADLRERSDIFLVAAFNKDVQTFDNMVASLHFHMYQPVILANMGEFGGSSAQAPLPKHDRLIAHVHGNNQVAVSLFEIDPAPFKSTAKSKFARELKTPPAGYKGRPKC